MNPRKRSAVEPLLPLRSPKQPRTNLYSSDGWKYSGLSKSDGILNRWKSLGKELFVLGLDTIHSIQGASAQASGSVSGSEPRSSHSPDPQARLLNSPPPRRITLRDNHFASPQSSPPRTFSFSASSNTTSTAPRPNRPLFQRPTAPLITSHSKTRPSRFRRPMLPPPSPPRSPVQFPSLPGPPERTSPTRLHSETPVAGSSKAGSSQGIPSYYKKREHIFGQKHKRDVRTQLEQIKEDMVQQLYIMHQREGYRANIATFQKFLAYRQKLERDVAVDGDRLPRFSVPDGRSTGNLLSASYSLTDLRSGELPGRTRRHSTPTFDISPDFLESALHKARATLLEPKPPTPFNPALEQLRLRDRSKDAAIEQRLRPKPIPLPSSLPPEEEEAVTQFLRKRGTIAKYAKEQVSDTDIERLRPGKWLNDEVINFYGAMIMGRSDGCKENPSVNGAANGKNKNKPLNVHYFSTFFWSKLEKEGYEKGRLAKWTKKIDIFTKDVILVPVNHNNTHWTGAAINFRRKRIESYDSMNIDRRLVFKRLRGYLDAEHRNKKKQPFDFTGWEDHTLEDTPQQENGYDCGVFTCQFLESLSRGQEVFGFTQHDIPYLRRRMIWEIGNASLYDS